jgi:hypothetical protein
VRGRLGQYAQVPFVPQGKRQRDREARLSQDKVRGKN